MVFVAGYVALMGALGVVALRVSGWNVATWGAIGLVSAGAVAVGAWRNAPRQRVPWLLLSAAILATTVGDVEYSSDVSQTATLPLISDACYLTVVPLIMMSLIALTRTSVVLSDRSRLLDLVTFSCAAVVVAWVFLIGPSLNAPGLNSADRSMIAVCIGGDLLILLVTLRLVLTARWSWSVSMLAVGAVGTLVGDIVYTLARVRGSWHPGGPADGWYLVFYTAWGAAALHPSMTRLTAPVDTGPGRLNQGTTWLMRLALMIPPATLLIGAATGGARYLVVIAVASMVIGELVITRLSDTVAQHRRAVARERALRAACGTLVSALDVAEVSVAVRTAVGQLMPPGVEHAMVLSLRQDPPDPAPAEFGLGDLDLLPAPGADRRSRLVRTGILHPALRVRLGAFETALVCPLVPGVCSAGDSGAGALVIAAHERAITAMRDCVEVLAAQASLALERIALNSMVSRRDGDRYLRTVVRNTADIVLVIDDDHRIRYASPSLTTILGVDPSVYAKLWDIVHPDDHEQVTRTQTAAERSRDAHGVRDVWNLRGADGSRVQVEVSFRDLRRDRMVRGFVITMRDATVQREHEQELIRDALRGSGAWQNRKSSLNRFR